LCFKTIPIQTWNRSREADNFFNLASVVWEATAPDEDLTGQYAVTQTKALIGKRGTAILVGVTKVKLDDTDEGEFADPQEDDLEYMKTSDSGKFPVLGVHEFAVSETWGYVLLGAGTEGDVAFCGIVQSTIAAGDSDYPDGAVTVKRAEGELGSLTVISGDANKELTAQSVPILSLKEDDEVYVVSSGSSVDPEWLAFPLNPAAPAYKATSDVGEGPLEDDEIEVKRVDSEGNVTGDAEVWKVLPE